MASPTPAFTSSSSIKGPPAMVLLDEAVSLIRQASFPLLSIYYIGALPFCLAVIYFWFDMTQGADAEAHLPAEALALTGLYVWMKTFQAIFARRLLALLEGGDEEPWTLSRVARTALLQAIFAGSLLLVYPVAMVITLPFGWVSAFYHNISIVGTGPKSTVRGCITEATGLSRLWPKQNHLILGILLIAFAILFFNLAVLCMTIPGLLNAFFGVETIFDENPYAWNNSSFYLDLLIFCFLILNPLNKAVYALRCFYGRSRLTGADLKSALRRFSVTKMSSVSIRTAALILLLSFLATGNRAEADAAPTPAAPPPANSVVPGESTSTSLDHAITKTLQKDEFAWRMPRVETSVDESDGWMVKTLRSVLKFFGHLLDKPFKWLGKFFEWFFKTDSKHDDANASSSFWQRLGDLRWKEIFIFFAIIAVAVLLYFLVRHLRLRPNQASGPLAVAPVRTVDLEAEDVRADELPEDSWLALAQQMIERGEMRLALRAFYLATLSVLAGQQLVRLSPVKSNRDYLQELTRRLRGNVAFLGHFRENIHLFEASWYGTHAVTTSIIETMRANHQQMRNHAAP